jgi:hypothetical protein
MSLFLGLHRAAKLGWFEGGALFGQLEYEAAGLRGVP